MGKFLEVVKKAKRKIALGLVITATTIGGQAVVAEAVAKTSEYDLQKKAEGLVKAGLIIPEDVVHISSSYLGLDRTPINPAMKEIYDVNENGKLDPGDVEMVKKAITAVRNQALKRSEKQIEEVQELVRTGDISLEDAKTIENLGKEGTGKISSGLKALLTKNHSKIIDGKITGEISAVEYVRIIETAVRNVYLEDAIKTSRYYSSSFDQKVAEGVLTEADFEAAQVFVQSGNVEPLVKRGGPRVEILLDENRDGVDRKDVEGLRKALERAKQAGVISPIKNVNNLDAPQKNSAIKNTGFNNSENEKRGMVPKSMN